MAVVMDALRESQSRVGVVRRGYFESWRWWHLSRMRGGSKPNGDLEGGADEKARRLQRAWCPLGTARRRGREWGDVGSKMAGPASLGLCKQWCWETITA